MSGIYLHPAQSEVFSDLFVEQTCRHSVVVASRGWGKSYFAAVSGMAAIFELLELDESVPNKNVYIIAPTYSQVTDIYHPLLAYQLGFENYCLKHSRDTGVFWFPKNVKLRLVSFEAVERLRGTGCYFAVNDEVSSWTKGVGLKSAWQSIIQPCISTRWSKKRADHYGAKSPGRSLTISTPKGYNYLYDMYHFAELDSDWRSYHFDYTTSPFLDEEEILRIRHTIDPLEFNREYKATFEDSGNNVFYCFDRKVHVAKKDEIPYFYPPSGGKPGEDVHVAIDFNVGIQASSAWAIRGDTAYCIDEFKGHPDTETLAMVLAKKYKGHRIYAYPDPTGRARKTSAAVGVTDFSLLQAHKLQVLARQKSPPIVDSVSAVNRRLRTAAGGVHVKIRPECQGVIKSLERTTWVDNNPDLAVIDKSEGIEHYSDGIRYFFEYKWPIRSGTVRTKVGHNF